MASEDTVPMVRQRLSYAHRLEASHTSPAVTNQAGSGPCSRTQHPGTATAEPHSPSAKPTARAGSPHSSLETDAEMWLLPKVGPKSFCSISWLLSSCKAAGAGPAAPLLSPWGRTGPAPHLPPPLSTASTAANGEACSIWAVGFGFCF